MAQMAGDEEEMKEQTQQSLGLGHHLGEGGEMGEMGPMPLARMEVSGKHTDASLFPAVGSAARASLPTALRVSQLA
jgi:hypothetical protein